MLNSPQISPQTKSSLKLTYSKLDPVVLLKELEQLQDSLWKHAWRPSRPNAGTYSEPPGMMITIMPPTSEDSQPPARKTASGIYNSSVKKNAKVPQNETQRKYRKTRKPAKAYKPRSGRTRKDPFENVAGEIEMQFQQNKRITAKQLLIILQERRPGEFSDAQRRTLLRRLENLRKSDDEAAIPSPVRQNYPKHITS